MATEICSETRALGTNVESTLLNCRIGAVRGAPSHVIQMLLGNFAVRTARQGFRIAGVVEIADTSADRCPRFAMRDLSSGSITSISQALGPHSTACNLDPSGVADACAAVERAIAVGADLVVLSKFGKLEAARGGLSDAFRTAIGASLPVLTAVSPAMSESWEQFAGPLSRFLSADAAAIEAWWSTVRDRLPDAA